MALSPPAQIRPSRLPQWQFSARVYFAPVRMSRLPLLSAGGIRLRRPTKTFSTTPLGPLLTKPKGASPFFSSHRLGCPVLALLTPTDLGFWICQQVPHTCAPLGSGPSLSGSFHGAHFSPQGSRPYLRESHTCLLLPQTPSAWRLLPGGGHRCRHSCSHVGACGRCRPGPGGSQGSLRLPA